MKKLVIAEKPSVAREIAKTLGSRDRADGYIDGSNYTVTWALGHLVQLAEPAAYSDKYKRWSIQDLPMLPEELSQTVIEDTKSQFKNIKRLLDNMNFDSVVIATDAGREGELVARWILKLCKYEGKVERLWISSQTEDAIKDGFNNLKDGSLYENLYKAAEARSAADWYVGMNVSRALTCHFDAKLSSGRVQTPTLALMTKREDEIEAFLGNYYYTARADFGLFSASYYPENNSIRFSDKALKEEFESSFIGKSGKIAELITEEKEEKAPLAYDLTELQRDANIALGFSAKETLDVLQKLYEVHKIVTYPRTDSRYITKDIVPTLPARIRALLNTDFSYVAEEYLANGYVVDEERFVSEAQVTDHHAIIPTEQKVNLANLDTREKDLWSLIALRFLEVISKPYTYKTTTAVINVDDKLFKTRLTIAKNQGFRQVAKAAKIKSTVMNETTDDTSFALLNVKEGDSVTVANIRVKEQATTPPDRYTDATLLSAMEHAGRFVEDKKLKSNLTNGLGTPATRAEIIEKLVQNHYVERDGKFLVPTSKGREVVRLAPSVLSSPELTGEWEARLDAISKGKEDFDSFIKDIKTMSSTLVEEVKKSSNVYSPKFTDSKQCPFCKGEMMKAKDRDGSIHYICQKLSCSYEEKEVKVKVDTGAVAKPKIDPNGKVKVTIKKGAVKIPKAIYETKIEVVRESKLRYRENRNQDRNFVKRDNNRGNFKESSSGGGTMADFFKQSQERQEKQNKKRK